MPGTVSTSTEARECGATVTGCHVSWPLSVIGASQTFAVVVFDGVERRHAEGSLRLRVVPAFLFRLLGLRHRSSVKRNDPLASGNSDGCEVCRIEQKPQWRIC
jgi:hypothetical protein